MKRREREINPKKNKLYTISWSQLIDQCPVCPLAAINLISILFLKLNTALCQLLRRKLFPRQNQDSWIAVHGLRLRGRWTCSSHAYWASWNSFSLVHNNGYLWCSVLWRLQIGHGNCDQMSPWPFSTRDKHTSCKGFLWFGAEERGGRFLIQPSRLRKISRILLWVMCEMKVLAMHSNYWKLKGKNS